GFSLRQSKKRLNDSMQSIGCQRTVFLFVFPGFADWEAAHAVAELRRQGGYSVEAVGLSMNLVGSMGEIKIQPSRRLADIDLSDVAMFILPGGDRWEQHPHEPELIRVLTELDSRRIPIAAICAATTAVVRAALLRGRRHTSNEWRTCANKYRTIVKRRRTSMRQRSGITA